MDPKKNPKADLAKNSALYFAIGLCLVLFLSWKLVEHKTYEKSSIDIGMLTVNEDEIEDVPLTWQDELLNLSTSLSVGGSVSRDNAPVMCVCKFLK